MADASGNLAPWRERVESQFTPALGGHQSEVGQNVGRNSRFVRRTGPAVGPAGENGRFDSRFSGFYNGDSMNSENGVEWEYSVGDTT